MLKAADTFYFIALNGKHQNAQKNQCKSSLLEVNKNEQI